MKRQLQGIALILFSILLMLGYGNAPFFDFSFRWSFEIYSPPLQSSLLLTFG